MNSPGKGVSDVASGNVGGVSGIGGGGDQSDYKKHKLCESVET